MHLYFIGRVFLAFHLTHRSLRPSVLVVKRGTMNDLKLFFFGGVGGGTWISNLSSNFSL